MQAYLCFSLFVCVGLEGPVGKNSVAFKSWRSLEKNTEGKRERGEERERGRWENSDGKKEWDRGGRFQPPAWNQVIIGMERCQFVWRSVSRTGKE